MYHTFHILTMSDLNVLFNYLFFIFLNGSYIYF